MININELKNFNDCMDCVKENHNLSYEEVVSPILDMLKEKCIESGLNPSENDRYLEMEYDLQYHHLIYNLLLNKDFTNTDEVVSKLNKKDMEYGCNPYYLVKPHSNYGLTYTNQLVLKRFVEHSCGDDYKGELVINYNHTKDGIHINDVKYNKSK